MDVENYSEFFKESSVVHVLLRLLSRSRQVLALMFFISHFATPELFFYHGFPNALVDNLFFMVTVLIVFLLIGVSLCQIPEADVSIAERKNGPPVLYFTKTFSVLCVFKCLLSFPSVLQ